MGGLGDLVDAPSASPDLTNSFDCTYNQLQYVSAAGISQTEKALTSQSFQVSLRPEIVETWSRSSTSAAPGRWTHPAEQSAGQRGLRPSTYKTLMPLLYSALSGHRLSPHGERHLLQLSVCAGKSCSGTG